MQTFLIRRLRAYFQLSPCCVWQFIHDDLAICAVLLQSVHLDLPCLHCLEDNYSFANLQFKNLSGEGLREDRKSSWFPHPNPQSIVIKFCFCGMVSKKPRATFGTVLKTALFLTMSEPNFFAPHLLEIKCQGQLE